MGSIVTELLLILLLLVFNGALAMAETAVVSSRKARLRQRADAGDQGAATALTLAEDPTRFLSTVQIGITLVGILAGAFGGARVSQVLAVALAGVPLLAPYADPIALGLVVALITYLSLIVGELVPKRLALNAPERVAALVARPMRLLSAFAAPLVAILTVSTDGILRLLRAQPAAEPAVTEEEVNILLTEGAEAGVFQPAERDLVAGVFELGDRHISELMTPRPKIAWLDVEDPPATNWAEIARGPHTTFPVCQGDLDRVIGVVSLKALWADVIDGRQPDLAALAREPLYVPQTLGAFRVLELFRESSPDAPRVALVLDETGGVEGLVTPADLLEALVGDITPSTGATADAAGLVRRADGSYLADGLLRVDELRALMPADGWAAAERALEQEGYGTLGGLTMGELGRVPRTGEAFTWHGLRFEVMDMDGRRVDKLLVSSDAERVPAGADAVGEPLF